MNVKYELLLCLRPEKAAIFGDEGLTHSLVFKYV